MTARASELIHGRRYTSAAAPERPGLTITTCRRGKCGNNVIICFTTHIYSFVTAHDASHGGPITGQCPDQKHRQLGGLKKHDTMILTAKRVSVSGTPIQPAGAASRQSTRRAAAETAATETTVIVFFIILVLYQLANQTRPTVRPGGDHTARPSRKRANG